MTAGHGRPIWHAFELWRREPGQEFRREAACGLRGGDLEIGPDGEARCLACARAVLAGAGAGEGEPGPEAPP
jgi:hypothetical protein